VAIRDDSCHSNTAEQVLAGRSCHTFWFQWETGLLEHTPDPQGKLHNSGDDTLPCWDIYGDYVDILVDTKL